MRDKIQDETYDEYLQNLIDEVVGHGQYFIIICKSTQTGIDQIQIETRCVQKEFPYDQIHATLQRVAVTYANILASKQAPINITINENEGG